MIFNQGYSDFPSLQCDKCTNKDICKYLNVECKKFSKNKR